MRNQVRQESWGINNRTNCESYDVLINRDQIRKQRIFKTIRILYGAFH